MVIGKAKPTTETRRHGEESRSGDLVIGKENLPRMDADERGSERTGIGKAKPTTEARRRKQVGRSGDRKNKSLPLMNTEEIGNWVSWQIGN
jgi:hypothetical protein